MDTLPPILRDQRKVDADQLRLLSIFHFVGAGFAALGLLFLFAHYSMFHLLFSDPKMFEGQKGGPPPKELFQVLRWFYLLFGLWFLASFVLNLVSGFYLRAGKCRAFSLVVAGINCLHMPLGTVLGVFTIVVLARESVKEVYGA